MLFLFLSPSPSLSGLQEDGWSLKSQLILIKYEALRRKHNPEPWVALSFIYIPHDTSIQHPPQYNCSKMWTVAVYGCLTIAFGCAHLNCPSHKVSLKLCAGGAKLSFVTWLIHCYLGSLPRTDLCLNHCLSWTLHSHLAYKTGIHTNAHTSILSAFLDFFLPFLLHEKKEYEPKSVYHEKPNRQHGILSNEICPDDLCINNFMMEIDTEGGKRRAQ